MSIRNKLTKAALTAAALITVVLSARADTTVHTGSLSGGGTQTQTVQLPQFDTLGGSRVLDSVRLEVATSVIGGCQTNGSGIPTTILARLESDFFLGTRKLVDTEALISTTLSNVGPPVALTFFDNDLGTRDIVGAAGLAPWIGVGRVTLTAASSFVISEDPAQSVFFSAGGSIHWTVTYTWHGGP